MPAKTWLKNWHLISLTTVCSLSLIAIVALATGSQAKALEKTPSVDAIHLKQKHGYFGNTETWISTNAIRFDSDPKQSFSVIARAPDWSIHAFRMPDKTIYSQKLADFAQTGLVSNIVFKYRGHDDFLDSPAEPSTFGPFKTIRRHHKRDFIEYIPSDKLLTQNAETILYAINRVTTNGGITLTFTLPAVKRDLLEGTNLDKKDRALLQTSRAEYVKVAPSIFEVPKNYRPVKIVQQIINAHTESDDIKDFVDSLDSPKK